MHTISFAVAFSVNIQHSSKFTNLFVEDFYLVLEAFEILDFISAFHYSFFFIWDNQSSTRSAFLIALPLSEPSARFVTNSILSSMQLSLWIYIPWRMVENSKRRRICLSSLSKKTVILALKPSFSSSFLPCHLLSASLSSLKDPSSFTNTYNSNASIVT